jgi:hypothetical protein
VSYLQVVIINHKSQKPREQVFALFFRQIVDMVNMVSNSEDGLPSGDWVGANYWMIRLEISPTFSTAPRGAE